MQCSTRYPDGAAGWHDPKAALYFATQRPFLNQDNLALPVEVKAQLDPTHLCHSDTEAHDRPGHSVRIHPVRVRQWLSHHRHRSALLSRVGVIGQYFVWI